MAAEPQSQQVLPQAGPATLRVLPPADPPMVPGASEAAPRLCQLGSCRLGGSDLGPPALDELHDLLDLQLGEVEVVGQDVLTELHKDAAIYALPGKEAHHIL